MYIIIIVIICIYIFSTVVLYVYHHNIPITLISDFKSSSRKTRWSFIYVIYGLGRFKFEILICDVGIKVRKWFEPRRVGIISSRCISLFIHTQSSITLNRIVLGWLVRKQWMCVYIYSSVSVCIQYTYYLFVWQS